MTTCFRCLHEFSEPLTPARFWRGGSHGRWVAAPLCAKCLRAARGSLLYKVDLEKIKELLAGPDREAWLSSLHPADRQAVLEEPTS